MTLTRLLVATLGLPEEKLVPLRLWLLRLALLVSVCSSSAGVVDRQLTITAPKKVGEDIARGITEIR